MLCTSESNSVDTLCRLSIVWNILNKYRSLKTGYLGLFEKKYLLLEHYVQTDMSGTVTLPQFQNPFQPRPCFCWNFALNSFGLECSMAATLLHQIIKKLRRTNCILLSFFGENYFCENFHLGIERYNEIKLNVIYYL